MGLQAECLRIGNLVLEYAPDLKDKIYFGKKYLPKSMSAPSLIFCPGGMPDRLVGSQSAARVPRSLRTRGAACTAWIFGKSLTTRAGMTKSQSGDDYTDTEWLLHTVIAAMHQCCFGKIHIDNPRFVDEGDIAQYGDHFQLPFFIAMTVDELQPPTEVTITEVEVIRGTANWDDIL